MRKEKKGENLGKAVIRPSHPVIAGKPYAWDIVFTCGERGIARGGALRVDIPYGFTPPQLSYPAQVGFTTVETSNGDVHTILHLHDPTRAGSNQGTWGVHLYVEIEGGELNPGDTVTVHYGKGDGAGLANVGAFAQYFEGETEFTVLVDPDGTRNAPHGGFLLIDDPQPRVCVVGDAASHLYVVVPSITRENESVSVKITARDRHGNTATGFDGDVVLSISEKGSEAGRAVMHEGSSHVVLPGADEVPFRVRVESADRRVAGLSNPSLPVSDPNHFQLYWGDLHVMTKISAGLGSPGSALEYARDKSHLDFCAVTDGDAADGYYTDDEWEETRQAVRELYEPGQFVTILASEYHERRVAGDKNVYYPDDDARLIRWSDLEGHQPQALWKALEGTRALTVPHHTVSGSGGLRPWEHHHPEFQRLVEIYSIWGNSECEGCRRPNYWRNNFQNSVQNGLAKGYRMGIIASGDSHDGLAGNSSWMRVRKGWRNGLAALWASELTRESVFDALWSRHCYGTSGERIILLFTLNGARMGEELSSERDRAERRLRIRVLGTAPVSRIVIVRNSEEAHVREGTSDDEDFEWVDDEEFNRVSMADYGGKPFIYYYVRVEQAGGELAWSSPIWIS